MLSSSLISANWDSAVQYITLSGIGKPGKHWHFKGCHQILAELKSRLRDSCGLSDPFFKKKSERVVSFRENHPGE